ncbi:MAG TPA: YncE family protein [Panacibacter sp.]|nr:YncE family protein [Panacibacter sp.]
MKKGLFVFAMAFICQKMIAQNTQYKVVKTFHIASSGGWDYIAVHGNKLYVSHSTQVNILDKNSGDSLGIIAGTTGVHGIAFDDADGKGFTSNGRLNNVFVFDLNTDKISDSINVGKNPDAIMYEPFTKRIITCNGRSNDLSVIDPVTNKVVAAIAVEGKPETAVGNGLGKLFVNIEDKNMIAVIDLQSFKMEAAWPLDGGKEPTGLAFDKATNRLFAGCDKLLVVLDASTGKVVRKIPIGEGCDGVAFDNNTKTIFTSNGEDGTMTVIKEKSANEFAVVENVATRKSARTITFDAQSNTVFLPAADMEPNTPEGQWPKMVPGTFQVLVIKK